jgi:hypothetical protein
MEAQKRCCACREKRPLDAFGVNRSRPDGLQSICKPCRKTYDYVRYRKNPSGWIRKNSERRAAQVEFVRSLKDKPCADCGIKYQPWVMDFDHVIGKKIFNLGSVGKKIVAHDRIVAEANKCDVVCANCHRERTYRAVEAGKAKNKR